MKICKLIIRGYQQFKDLELDFTDPKTGQPADKICFIGRNGTGKSTILRKLNDIMREFPAGLPRTGNFIALKFKTGSRFYYAIAGGSGRPVHFLDGAVDSRQGWADPYLHENSSRAVSIDPNHQKFRVTGDDHDRLYEKLPFKNDSSDLVIYSPSETRQNLSMETADVPEANLDSALRLFKDFPFSSEVSNQKVREMWRMLVYQVKKRDNDREEFENLPENLSKTKAELIAEFDKGHPKALHALAKLWNPILEPAGLYFDADGAKNPIQLTDNLVAHIKLKSTNEVIQYRMLSTGIRDFLFRIGHIFLLYFERKIERGIMLIDEPENSLFPDFLFSLMETYDTIVRNEDGTSGTQMFFATHSPIVAAQFEPYQRVVLEWNDEGYVTAHKGHAPIGDDPNDLLRKDFHLPNLMGRAGLEAWDKYQDLRRQLRRKNGTDETKDLAEQAMELGAAYGFTPNESE